MYRVSPSSDKVKALKSNFSGCVQASSVCSGMCSKDKMTLDEKGNATLIVCSHHAGTIMGKTKPATLTPQQAQGCTLGKFQPRLGVYPGPLQAAALAARA